MSSIFDENREQHGEIFKLKLLNLDPQLPEVVVHDEEVPKRLLMEENISVNSAWPQDVLDLLGKKGALLRYTGEEHRKVRKVIAEGLCKSTVERFSFSIIERIVQRYLNRWTAMETVPIFSETRALSCEVAASGKSSGWQTIESRLCFYSEQPETDLNSYVMLYSFAWDRI